MFSKQAEICPVDWEFTGCIIERNEIAEGTVHRKPTEEIGVRVKEFRLTDTSYFLLNSITKVFGINYLAEPDGRSWSLQEYQGYLYSSDNAVRILLVSSVYQN